MLTTLIGIYYPTNRNLPVIVMEKMQYSLRKFVDSRNIIQWDKKLSILDDVCCGLYYLHSRNPPIIHRDLTPNNILLCSHLRAKITDLGVARTLLKSDTKLTKAPGTPDFMPPECAADNPVYGLPLDMFSFGGIILYVCLQQWPNLPSYIEFDSDGNKRILTELERRQHHLDDMIGANKDLKSLSVSCLDDNPKNRPLVGEALMEIKQVKNAYNEKMYCTISAPSEQCTTQPQDQQEQPQPLQQQKLDQQHNLEQQQVNSDICMYAYVICVLRLHLLYFGKDKSWHPCITRFSPSHDT